MNKLQVNTGEEIEHGIREQLYFKYITRSLFFDYSKRFEIEILRLPLLAP